MNYTKIWTVATTYTYNYLKYDFSNLDKYNVSDFIDHITYLKNIKISPIHFQDTGITGLTIIDSKGKSIHYEKSNPTSRQNFTKCHELGHILSNHYGKMNLGAELP